MTTPTVLRTFGSMSDKPTREICHEAATLIERQAAQIKMMREALKEIRDDFDCDADAHKYGTTCRCCLAEEVLATTPEQALGQFAAIADLSGVIMCEKKPVAYMAVYKDQVMGFIPTQESGTIPVYRAIKELPK